MNARLLKGTGITDEGRASLVSSFCEAHCAVLKRHGVCGDSAFIYADEKRALFGIFDGVSGEPSADKASSVAAETLMDELKKAGIITRKTIKEALLSAHIKIEHSFTTALVVSVKKDGSYIAASVGDSVLYSIAKDGTTHLEMPLGRIVGKGDTTFRFLLFRNVVKSVLGRDIGGMEIRFQNGKMSPGDTLIAASDCLPDNLKLEVSEYNVEDASGTKDLRKIIGRDKSPGKILGKIVKEMEARMEKKVRRQEGSSLLVPKLDDLAIVVFRKGVKS